MDAETCKKINGDYNPERKRCTIKHIDEVRGMGKVPDGWYRVPGMEGFSWTHYTGGKKDFILDASEDEDHRRGIELWIGDLESGDSETIAHHRKSRMIEAEAEKWIFSNPKGWE